MFGANRISIITKANENDTSFNETHKPICCIGLDSIFYAKKMKKLKKLVKFFKAYLTDTRLDILRMISFGLKTNKKLSKFFKVS